MTQRIAASGRLWAMTRATIERCRELRRESSVPERLIWSKLRAAHFGVKFRRQHPVGPYIADFYCHAFKLGVEIDGMTHASVAAPEHDRRRDAWMRAQGYRILRIPVADISKSLSDVLERIQRELV